VHFNFADFTLSAWVKIPDFNACGSDGVAAGERVCAIGGRFSPIGSPLSGEVNDWYAFGYLLTVSNSGSPDGKFYAQVSVGNGPFMPLTTHIHLGTAIQNNHWHHIAAKFNSARYCQVQFRAVLREQLRRADGMRGWCLQCPRCELR